MKTLTPEIKKVLEARRDEIIVRVTKGCLKQSSYNFNTSGWFDLFNWLTKEKPEWWKKFYAWAEYENKETYMKRNHHIQLNENLPQLFVEWLWESETGWWEKCPGCALYGKKSAFNFEEDTYICGLCNGIGKILTPLGKLFQEIIS